MIEQRERAVAPTTAPKSIAIESYQKHSHWATESQVRLGELAILWACGDSSYEERATCLRAIERLIRFRIDLELFREEDLNV